MRLSEDVSSEAEVARTGEDAATTLGRDDDSAAGKSSSSPSGCFSAAAMLLDGYDDGDEGGG